MIESMGKTASLHYGKDPKEVTVRGLRVDRVLKNGDIIDMGPEKILAFETKGHTDCSMSYLLEPEGILLASEDVYKRQISCRQHGRIRTDERNAGSHRRIQSQ